MRRVIDDTLLYEYDIEKSFRQVAEYLSLVGNNGIILNPDKFTYAGGGGQDFKGKGGTTRGPRAGNQTIPYSCMQPNESKSIFGNRK